LLHKKKNNIPSGYSTASIMTICFHDWVPSCTNGCLLSPPSICCINHNYFFFTTKNLVAAITAIHYSLWVPDCANHYGVLSIPVDTWLYQSQQIVSPTVIPGCHHDDNLLSSLPTPGCINHNNLMSPLRTWPRILTDPVWTEDCLWQIPSYCTPITTLAVLFGGPAAPMTTNHYHHLETRQHQSQHIIQTTTGTTLSTTGLLVEPGTRLHRQRHHPCLVFIVQPRKRF
jgi:hypothetical protein